MDWHLKIGKKIVFVVIAVAASLPVLAANETNKTPSIVSLAPSNTELLLDVGASNAISGICSNCTTHLPDGKNRLQGKTTAGSFTAANLERLTRLKPDMVLLVSGQEAISSQLTKRGFKVVLLKNDKIDKIPENIRQIGKLSNSEEKAEKLAVKFQSALKDLSATLGGGGAKPKVFYCIWPQPLLTIGKTSFLNDAVTTCGGINIAANLPQPYPQYSAEHLILADPDVIVLPFEAKDLALFKRFPWNKLRAVKEKRLFYLPAPKDDMLARPTMGVLDGLYWLTIKIHPELSSKLRGWRTKYCSPETKG